MEVAAKTALIVDDSATARIMLARVLNSMEIQSRQAKSGEEALKVLTQDRPNLIFLDHLMPGMDGFQTLKALKSNPDTRHIPVIMYTSQNALKYQEEAKLLGAAGVITKQVDREALYLLVEKAFMQEELRSRPRAEEALSARQPAEIVLESETELRHEAPEIAETESSETLDAVPPTPFEVDADFPRLLRKIRRLQWLAASLLIVAFYSWLEIKEQDAELKIVKSQLVNLQANHDRQTQALESLNANQAESRRIMAEMAEMLSLVQESR